ncbi:MAG: DUF5063 domain-containing protein, partial [Bacteroidota bacterium]|nr:DUF5063 domain-containing protein [Bacteroidota bacterium]
MENEEGFSVFSTEVIDFVKSANAFCELVYSFGDLKRSKVLLELQEVLPHLYLYALALPKMEPFYEDGNEKFVTEEEYDNLKALLADKFAYLNDYPEISGTESPDSGAPIVSCLSEDICDIYQDLKDFISLYRMGSNEIMNDAIWEIKLNFERYWGQTLVNALRYIHQVLYSEETIDDNENQSNAGSSQSNIDTSSWFITKRQEEYRGNGKKGND